MESAAIGEVSLQLRNMEGVFLEVVGEEDPPFVVETESNASGSQLDGGDHEGGDHEGGDHEGGDHTGGDRVEELQLALQEATRRNDQLEGEVNTLRRETETIRNRMTEVWRSSCDQLAEHDRILTLNDEELGRLRARVRELEAQDPQPGSQAGTPQSRSLLPPLPGSQTESPPPLPVLPSNTHPASRRGKAPPVELFSGEGTDILLDDWLPGLQRAADWNGWTQQELLWQLPGHLKGRARQEWSLISESEKSSYEDVVRTLRTRLDPGSKVLAAQDFRHTSQKDNESVTEFIRRLECVFRVAYGRDNMSADTRDTLLHGQLQDGLKQELMAAPAVSGSQTFRELCLASKNEEKRLVELRKRRQYANQRQTPVDPRFVNQRQTTVDRRFGRPTGAAPMAAYPRSPQSTFERRCYNCDQVGHRYKDCPVPKSESTGRGFKRSEKPPGTKSVRASSLSDPISTPSEASQPSPTQMAGNGQNMSGEVLGLLFSDSDEDGDVRTVRVDDEGSGPRHADVEIEGVPAVGLIDTGADITIIGPQLFKQVASVRRLKKKNLKKVDKVPRTYEQKPFALHGRMDLDISFGGKTMQTPVYIKMDAPEPLLLSEGVCRQLGIVSYHPSVHPTATSEEDGEKPGKRAPMVPAVRVYLLQSVKVPSGCSSVVPVRIGGYTGTKDTILLERDPCFEERTGFLVEDSLLQPTDGSAFIRLSNVTAFDGNLEEGTLIGEAEEVSFIDPATENGDTTDSCCELVRRVSFQDDLERRKRVAEFVGEPDLPQREKEILCDFLADHHEAFSLCVGERGETDLVQMEIETGDVRPKKQPLRRMPFAARHEIAKQVHEMQRNCVIQPSKSPWSSPVVLVQKKDGTSRFCIDYRALNSVTKADTFPLPRIDDMLDRLGRSKYFSTLDLASGFWQIKMHPQSQEKTAFATPNGLYEFRVMPFGLTNAPGVFQRLMEQVVIGLNPESGPDFVSAYIDDILIFSPTLEDHLKHLRLVFDRLEEVGLKLKASKCQFARKEVDYLGHVITPDGLKPNAKLVEAVQNYPRPTSLQDLRRFLGLTSYYRKFIAGFSKVAQPLHHLTGKGVAFSWSEECEAAYQKLKTKLVSAPVLAYPSFDRDFVLETDASIKGLGAVLSQVQSDNQLHPIAFASRALSPPEKNYGVTDLETLAVVWAMSHFHYYLYGHNVTVFTDHSAVKAVLGSPSLTGKHARWWARVFTQGVKEVRIVHRPGKENTNADSLSRNPGVGGSLPEEGVALVAVIRAPQIQHDAGDDIPTLLYKDPSGDQVSFDFASEQGKDSQVKDLLDYLDKGELPADEKLARKIAAQAPSFCVIHGVLHYLDTKRGHRRRVVVPKQLRTIVMEESHGGPLGGHFFGKKLYTTLVGCWYWERMYLDCMEFARNCPQCAIVSGSGRRNKPPLHPIPVQRPFQIVGVDIMDLPLTTSGNRHVVVFQDFFTKWPLVFPVPDQKTIRLVKLLVKEVVPFFGVPDALLSDRGTNLLSHLMRDVCAMLGTKKLNTTSYHPECDGMVERFNRTLKATLRKHADKFGPQWDQYLDGILWAYRNTPHETTGEKPSFLLFGIDCRSPTEAALLPPSSLDPTELDDYREEFVLSLSSARRLAVENIKKAQKRYKCQYDKRATQVRFKIGQWVLVKFPHEESGRQRKLSRPWHGPYRVVACNDPDLTVVKVYFPEDGSIQIHQSRVSVCPSGFPAGFYWYGKKKRSTDCCPRWVKNLLDGAPDPDDDPETDSVPHPESVRLDTPLPLVDQTEVESEAESEAEPEPDPGPEPTPEPGPEREPELLQSAPAARSAHYSLRKQLRPPQRFH